jgi:hypothetical protein
MPELRRTFAMSHLPFSYELSGWVKPFVLGKDDAGLHNIADRPQFSEGRGHYWLWKNWTFHDEFVAINQYRRCFWFPHLLDHNHPAWIRYAEHANKHLAQTILHMTRAEYIAYIQAVDNAPEDKRARLNEWLSGADIVVNRPLEYPRSIATIYGEHHRANDWEIFASVCRKRGYDDGRHYWLTGHLMFIMRPALFDEYMTAWWAVMSDVDPLLEQEGGYQGRKIGYLSERFISAWLVRTRTERPWVRVQTAPIVEGLFQLDRTDPGVM